MSLTPTKPSLRAGRRSLTRRLWHDDKLSPDIVHALEAGEADRLLFASTPLQVKDRCIAARLDHSGGPLLIKQHLWGGMGRTLRSLGRKASARQCGEVGLALNQVGIRTPMPRACLEERFGPWGLRSYLITDYIEGTSLYRYIRFESQTDDELRHVASQIAYIWLQLVDAGFSHNDMKPENFIVDKNLDVWLIDLEKVRLRGNAARQRRRSIADVQNFLHVRSWHHRRHAREIFREAILETRYGHWFENDRAAIEDDPTLAVVLVLSETSDEESADRADDSVREIADEIVRVRPSTDGGFRVIRRELMCAHDANERSAHADDEGLTRCDWVLLLHEHEIVTPFLAKELQQTIAASRAAAARIAIEPQYFGRSVAYERGEKSAPVRLFRRDKCTLEFHNNELEIDAGAHSVTSLTGLIQRCVVSTVAEYVARLNEQSSREAEHRWARGDRPAMVRGVARSLWQTIRVAASRRGIGSGWTGLQIALLDGCFMLVEEAKLRQLCGEFFVKLSGDVADDMLLDPDIIRIRQTTDTVATVHRKAA